MTRVTRSVERSFQPGTIEAVTRQQKPRHKVYGIAAALLPYQTSGRVDVESFQRHLVATQQTQLINAVNMLGGLPKERTPLHPRITGAIQMDGFRIEKLIFESLPGLYVSALVYVPEDGNKSHPAILVPAGHAANGKVHYQALCQRLVQRGYFVISWDPVGQGERSQFWDAKAGKSRYNLICAEHEHRPCRAPEGRSRLKVQRCIFFCKRALYHGLPHNQR